MAEPATDLDGSSAAPARVGRPLRLPKMAEVVAEYIRRDIVTGALAQGSSLPTPPVLMERFGVSKPTIREALRILESERLIEVRRGASGARVQLPSAEAAARSVGLLLQLEQTTLQDVWDARIVLEPPLAALLARSWRPDDLTKLRRNIESCRGLLPDAIRFAASQEDFHHLVVTLAGNRTLALLSRLLNEVVRLHEAVVNTDPAHDRLRRGALHEHERFLELVEARRDAEAADFWRAHLQGNARNLLVQASPQTVVDLYGNIPSRSEIRFPL